uniref:Uncharacterized protein n=1 Tax=Chaetoceros debilis TaxID=122233 RepID=A0A7S3PXY1_9STRA
MTMRKITRHYEYNGNNLANHPISAGTMEGPVVVRRQDHLSHTAAAYSHDEDLSTSTSSHCNCSQDTGCSFSAASSSNQSSQNKDNIRFYTGNNTQSQSSTAQFGSLDIEREASSSPIRGDTSTYSRRSGSTGSTGSASGNRGLTRSTSRSVFSTAEMSHAEAQPLTLTKYFGHDIYNFTDGSPDELNVDKALRSFIEPHISKARKMREEKRQVILDKIGLEPQMVQSLSIASNAYVPYPALRNERPFLFDADTYPLHQILADTIGVKDLSLIHEHTIQDKRTLMSPLLDAKKRKAFHKCYDNFVASFCIPLLHSLAMVQKMFIENETSESSKICYRYQAFPCLRVIRPGEFSIGPHCDLADGHSMGNINFHIPLTPTFGTNALYTESHPGREDWHALKTKSVGLGFSFDGARCLHFTLENTTPKTRVSLDFRIAIYRDNQGIAPIPKSNTTMMMNYSVLSRVEEEDGDEIQLHDSLCSKTMLKDNYSEAPGYYEDAYVDLGTLTTSTFPPGPMVHKRNRPNQLLHPDKRVGFPF